MVFFQPPKADPHAHRLVTNLELFLDLVFVAAILHLGNLQAVDFIDHTAGGKNGLASLFYFFGLWLTWYEFSSFMVRYFARDTVTAIHFALQGLFLLGMAAFTGDAFDGADRDHFAYAFFCSRCYFCLMHISVAACNPELRKTSAFYCGTFLFCGSMLMFASLVSVDVAIFFWVLGFVVEIGGCAWLHQRWAPKFNIELMAERHGELVMIAIGENIIQLVIGPVVWNYQHVMACIFGFMLAFMLQMLYYECQPEDEHEHAYHRGGFAAFLFAYMHSFYIFFLMGVGVSVKLFLKISQYKYTKPPYAWFMCSCLVFSLVCCNIIRLSHKAFRPEVQCEHKDKNAKPSPHKNLVKRAFWIIRFVLVGLIFLVSGMAYDLTAMASLGFLFGLTTLMALIDVYQRYLYPEMKPLETHHGGGGHDGYHPVKDHDDHHSVNDLHAAPAHHGDSSHHLA